MTKSQIFIIIDLVVLNIAVLAGIAILFSPRPMAPVPAPLMPTDVAEVPTPTPTDMPARPTATATLVMGEARPTTAAPRIKNSR